MSVTAEAINQAAIRPEHGHPAPATGAGDPQASHGDIGSFFFQLLDIVNPLQHIPIVSTVYRRLTGDEIAPAARLLGAGLFGGPAGMAAAVVGIAIESATGHDIGEHALAMVLPDDAATPSEDATLPDAQLASPVANDDPGNQETAADDTSIVWDGPRVAIAEAALAGSGTPAPASVPAGQVARALPVPPAGWLDVALAEAEASRQPHAEGGEPPTRPTGKPWIAAAMLQAMAKYEEMAKQRLHAPLVDLRATPNAR